MAKRLVVCCDGTWNTPDQQCDGRPCQTNVTKVARAVADRADDGLEQLVLYERGVGTSRTERIRGGAFGVGLSRGVQAVYRFLVQHFEPGDEVFFFGFSRGAYMARSAAGLIRSAGILRRENAERVTQAYALYRERSVRPRDVEAELFRRSFSHPEGPIRFIGVWDTVGALGIPWSGVPAIDRFNRRWQFHDTRLSSIVQHAYQALAIDEVRKPFAPAVWQQQDDAADQTLEQVWFSGVHSDVGGGYADTGLSDLPLRWMMERAAVCGLTLRAEAVVTGPNPLGVMHDSRKGFYRLVPPAPRAIAVAPGGREALASSALERMQQDGSYAPSNLVALRDRPHDVVQL